MFQILKTEDAARRGAFETPHGTVQTPVFMNVGTQAAIKGGLSSYDLEQIGCQIELSNTYHLHLRPGDDIVREMGGLHRFMNWSRPILTDSGGFQVFSLAKLRNISEEGVVFNSHIDGRRVHLTPEGAMAIQAALGSDIAMALDECVSNPSEYEYVKKSAERTVRWLARCKEEWLRQLGAGSVNPSQVLWGINQGGIFDDLRVENMRAIAELDLPGYAVGGLAVGEETEVMYHILDTVTDHMPPDRPRYLMGVGTPMNIIEAVYRGIDFFDCVMPARNARHGHLFTWSGVRNLKNEKYKADPEPIDPECACPACSRYSRAYVRHLLNAGEVLGLRLAVTHNLFFYNELTVKIRDALDGGFFDEFRRGCSEKLARRL